MFLNYFALAMILIVLVMIYYAFIYIHELPYETAKHRNHPHQDAIYVACWLSLFTLHAIWPLVFIWALTHKHKPGVDPALGTPAGGTPDHDLVARYTALENRLQLLEQKSSGQATSGQQTKHKKG
jgi:hypothetical protein